MGAQGSSWQSACQASAHVCARSALAGSLPAEKVQTTATGYRTPVCEVNITCDRFAMQRFASADGGVSWQKSYMLDRELGTGQHAAVFMAYVVEKTDASKSDLADVCSPRLDCDSGEVDCHSESVNCKQMSCDSMLNSGGWRSDSTAEQGTGIVQASSRSVALKRFMLDGTATFKLELQALLVAGVHPHVVRLFESYEGSEEDGDALVLEHCKGGDLYEFYASSKASTGSTMAEVFVMQLVRQILLALQHLVRRGIEHRDIKPENILLFHASDAEQASVPWLKLADFGWAVVVPPGGDLPPVPPGGVGSLWYAPPELNPPAPGVPTRPRLGCHRPGSSDMWSVGVITYLLLIGHSPFNTALRHNDIGQREHEVCRLAALGQFNTGSSSWEALSEDARQFVSSLIQPQVCRRLSAACALEHPWVTRWLAPSEPLPLMQRIFTEPAALNRWFSLDGFQKLAWLAVARAVGETELVDVPSLQEFIIQQSKDADSYLEQLAMELVSMAISAWFRPKASWGSVMALAFSYLDVDSDGLLSASDLALHIVADCPHAIAIDWLAAWGHGASIAMPVAGFRRALRATVTPQSNRTPRACNGKARPAGAIDQKSDNVSRAYMEELDALRHGI